MVHEKAPHLSILTLADYDVDGLNIVRCYRYSADPTSHGPSTLNPGIKWLGITTTQLLRIEASVSAEPWSNREAHNAAMDLEGGLFHSLTSTTSQDPIRHITQRDRKVAVGVLDELSRWALGDIVAENLMRELQRMLMLGAKCEIQWLDDAGDLVGWLDGELGGYH